MSNRSLRLATRNSPLALWQAEHVATLILATTPDLDVEFVSMATFADKRLDLPISDLGGKGAFSKEVQQLVLAGEADFAVHSAKDLQALTPDGLTIAAVPERGDPRDALVGATLEQLLERGPDAVIATGSNRRRIQLAAAAPSAHFVGLRGNIATRLERASGHDAIVMAFAALERLDLNLEVVEVLEPETMIPQVGQGALAIECRADDESTLEVLRRLDHPPSRRCLVAERAFLIELGGDCDLPAGAFATIDPDDDELIYRAVLASVDESVTRRIETRGADGAALGSAAAIELRRAIA